MSLMHTGTVAAPRVDTAQFYIGTDVARDSSFPFDGGDGFRARIVETVSGAHVLVLCTMECCIDVDATQLVLESSVDDGATGFVEDDVAANGHDLEERDAQ
jgi:hypothetical protein